MDILQKVVESIHAKNPRIMCECSNLTKRYGCYLHETVEVGVPVHILEEVPLRVVVVSKESDRGHLLHLVELIFQRS